METPSLPVAVITFLLGLIILTSGRRLFWLFVGVIGFAIAFQYGRTLFDLQSEMLQLLLALALGIGGALLAVFFQKVAIGLVGFAAGGYIALLSLELFGASTGSGPVSWLPFLIGGIIGSILLFVVFDWALIVISALAGAGMIVHVFDPSADPRLTLLFFGLAVLGIVIQAKSRRRSTPAPNPNRQGR